MTSAAGRASPTRGGQEIFGLCLELLPFTAVDYDDLHQEGISASGREQGLLAGVNAKGNFDYLMFADVDYRNKDVIAETIRWGEWFVETLGLDGMRLDALKHINSQFMAAFLRAMRLKTGKPLYFMGEYWRREGLELVSYLDETDAQMALFDVALHFHFQQASLSGRDYDLRTIFDGTLVKSNPLNAVTFVDNHDSQQGQALQSWVDGFFKELAYALILLRKDGYPCLFWGDVYGISGGPNPQPGWGQYIKPLLKARKEAAYGEQIDYFDHGNCIGSTPAPPGRTSPATLPTRSRWMRRARLLFTARGSRCPSTEGCKC